MGRRKQSNRTPEEVVAHVQNKLKNGNKLTVADRLTLQIDEIVKARTVNTRGSDELKATALVLYSQGCTTSYIAQALRMAPRTIQNWVASTEALDASNLPSNELLTTIKEQLPKKLYLLGNRVLNSVSDEDLEKASLQQKATSFAIMADKARLLEGNSTQNVSVMARHVHSLDSEEDKASDELIEMEAQIARIDSVIDSL